MSQSHVPVELRRRVRQRAGGRCEYCGIPETITFALHEVDHIVSEKHGGETTFDNLCLACTVCNKLKGSDLTSINPVTGKIVRLFHPRRQRWHNHFLFEKARIESRTIIGRVTIRLLQMNHPDRIRERELLAASDLLSGPAKKVR